MIRSIFACLSASLLFVSVTFASRPPDLGPAPFTQYGFAASSFAPDDDVRPLPPVHYVRSRDFDTKHIALELNFDWDKETTNGVERFTFTPLTPGFTSLRLDAGQMIFKSVRLADGTDLEHSYDSSKTLLTITLDRPYKVGEEVTVVIEYQTTGQPVENSLGFGGGGGLRFVKPTKDEPNKPLQIWSQGESEYNRYWFPSYDYPNDFRTTEITATVKKPLMVISNGYLVDTKDNGESRTFHWKMDTPYASYLTSIVVGEYSEIRGDYEGIPVSTYVYKEWQREGEITGKRLPDMVRFFSEKLDFKYPYTKYAQTIASEFGGGMENITATTQTDNMIIDERTELDEDQDGLQAHELAHQWFGDYVTCRDWSEIWLNESFATYMEGLWQLETKGKDYFLFNDLKSNQDQYFGAWRQGQRRPIVTKYYANPDAVFDTYAYPRGGAVLHMLRKQLGDENFFRALNHYLKSNANEPVQTEDLRIAIEESTGQSMDAFFDQWLYRMGHPVFDIKQDFDSVTGDLTLHVKQVQKRDMTSGYPQVQYFETPVEIEIVTSRGTQVETVFIEAKEENTFEFELEAKPLLVDFDNEGTLIKEVNFPKSVADLTYQAKNDGDILGRSWAMSELMKMATSKDAEVGFKDGVLKLMQAAAVSDPTWQLRRSAIDNIRLMATAPAAGPGQPRGDAQLDAETTEVLLKAANDPDSHVRADAIRLLGSSRSPKHFDLYLRAVNSDRSYNVIDAAAAAIGKTGNEDAYFVLRKLAQTDSWRNRVQISGLNALALMKDKRALDLGYKFATDAGTDPAVRDAALRIVSTSGKGDPKAFDLVFDNFKKALDNNKFQTLFSSIQAFINLADPRGQEAFDLLKEKFKNSQQIKGFMEQQEALFKASLNK